MTSDGTWIYTWEHGRQLKSMKGTGGTWVYSYDANGMRTQRTNSSTNITYEYVYTGSQLKKLKVGGSTLLFQYGTTGMPVGLTYNNTRYYYVTNLQGDVIAILNGSGTAVVTYTYDAWGNTLTIDGSMASTLGIYNPLRYRGYVYDQETGLYYLQSRYYNPAMGRFINADSVSCLGVDGSMVSYNLFSYCSNNPVMGYDPTGNWDWGGFALGLTVAAAGVFAVVAIVATAGTATPLVAMAATSIGMGAGVATIETGCAIMAAAATDSTAVLDISVTNGYTGEKDGLSLVLDFGNDTAELYSHVGATNTTSTGISYGSGVVFNYTGLGSYGGNFVDINGSFKAKGVDYGIDVCFDPAMLRGESGTSAMMMTVGLSLPSTGYASKSNIYVGADYYFPLASMSW